MCFKQEKILWCLFIHDNNDDLLRLLEALIFITH